ncbi:2',5'-phosphodiesterase 12-like isoform X1 [Clavelina lepadiformis]|uniref:2',5'-phosphodiesterase 12-like isoform X1 n=1 Tax=Clavelina lepadiformis TaxID=159417 RepID=UPI0040438E50
MKRFFQTNVRFSQVFGLLRTFQRQKIFRFQYLGKLLKWCKIDPKMARVVKVNVAPDDSIFTIALHNNRNRREFNRPIDEELERTVSRMISTLNPKKKKPPKKLQKVEGAESVHDEVMANPKISLLDAEEKEISLNCLSIEAWKQTKFLLINDDHYPVLYNPPIISQIKLSSVPLAGMTMYPRLQFRHSTANESKFTWYRTVHKDFSNLVETDNATECAHHDMNLENSSEWNEVGQSQTYTPSVDDIGHRIGLSVTPGNEKYQANKSHCGVQCGKTVSGSVKAGPNMCIFDERHKLINGRCPNDSVRVVCYNILADCYAETDTAKTLLFPYCSNEFMKIDYRIQLLQKELYGYHSDIIFLQEVDRFVFEDYLSPTMSLQNYASIFGNKQQTNEGGSIFYSRDKFRLVSVENKVLRESLQQDDIHDLVGQLLKNNNTFYHRVISRGSCVLVAVLQSVQFPERYLVVANTHLYFHPQAQHIRLIQMEVILNIVNKKVNELQSADRSLNVSYMVCGDLNSKPRTGLVEYMLTGRIPANHADWYSGGIETYHGTDICLSHDMKFISACGIPRYTNYVAGFSGCLDYIFINPEQFEVEKVLPQPDHKLVISETALPSSICSSDHIAQVVDLRWLPCEGRHS